ncbi:hypothetical protein EJ05DRAFT_508645 [Pseudovirgaria hyperparasitica]|uniref:Uncharacterized protein n=1 Tax=Pseudovirgaria hyperparasitica TaxID=470096 RepID=A0A6A6WHB8_9PEZI|nr:uncharacterized protein EJ05DRAFT_508645 [Pseudovirgaria hyperparasitica]KAF2761485.1 hypothetical protein EJ05DRAFT_508645 [Pseudovirgaria hyperparasitica]
MHVPAHPRELMNGDCIIRTHHLETLPKANIALIIFAFPAAPSSSKRPPHSRAGFREAVSSSSSMPARRTWAFYIWTRSICRSPALLQLGAKCWYSDARRAFVVRLENADEATMDELDAYESLAPSRREPG